MLRRGSLGKSASYVALAATRRALDVLQRGANPWVLPHSFACVRALPLRGRSAAVVPEGLLEPTQRRWWAQGLSDACRFEPDDDGRDHHHRAVVDCTLLITRRQATPLLEPIDAPLDHIPTRVDGLVKGQRPTTSCGAARPLIPSLRNRVRDLPLTQQPTTARVTVALIRDEPLRARSWSPAPAQPWDPNASQHRLQLRAVMPLPGRNDN